MVEIVYELSIFRTCMSNLLDKQAELNKEKAGFVDIRKEAEKELVELRKELNTNQKVLNDLEAEVERNEKDAETANRKEANQLRMKMYQVKKKVEQIQGKVTKISQNIEDQQVNIDSLNLKIPFLIHPVKLLGRDRYRNKYYFFSDEPTQIYMEPATEKNSLLETQPQDWLVIKTRKDIEKLRKSLSPFGIRELQLSEGIDNLIKNNFLKAKDIVETQTLNEKILSALNGLESYNSMYQPNHGQRRPKTRAVANNHSKWTISNMQLYFRNKFQQTPIETRCSLPFLFSVAREMEDELTRYLQSINAEWSLPETRLDLLRGLVDSSSLGELLIRISDGMRAGRRYVLKDRKEREAGKKSKMWNENEEESDGKEQSGEEEQSGDGEDGNDPEDQNAGEYEENKVWDLSKYRVSRSCNFEFGYYREKVRSAWRKLVAERHSLTSLYLAVAVYTDQIGYYINRKVVQIEERQANDPSAKPYTYGKSFHARYKNLIVSGNASKIMDEERAPSRSQRATNRHKLTDRVAI